MHLVRHVVLHLTGQQVEPRLDASARARPAARPAVSFGLARKITLGTGLILVLVGVVTTGLVARNTAQAVRAEFLAKGRAIALSVVAAGQAILTSDPIAVRAMAHQFRKIPGVAYVVIVDEWQTALRLHSFGRSVPDGFIEAVRVVDPSVEVVRDLRLTTIGRVTDVAEPMIADRLGVVHVGMSHALIDAAVRKAVLQTLALFGGGLVAAIVLAGLLARLLVRPVVALVATAQAIGRGEPHVPVTEVSRDEVGLLAREFNAMAEVVAEKEARLQSYATGLERRVDERTRALSETQERLRQAHKMEAIGRLAGGIAHDFNNLLTAILGHCELLTEEVRDHPSIAADVEEIRKAGERAGALTKQLLAFSRRQVLQPTVLQLNAVVADMDRMLRRLIGEHIRLVSALSPRLGRVKADRGQLEQVLMNLVVNARDAMPAGGTLTIETAEVEVDLARAEHDDPVQPGWYVTVAVTDTGCGMDRETRSRLFEPFFTTKLPGQGTGLGLATVYGIVNQTGGFIEVESAPGRGSRFTICLPRVEEPLDEHVPFLRSAEPPRDRETLLLVEDEPAVRTLLRQVLARAGYTVLEAANGAEAVERSERHAGSIALMVTDLVMPRMGGQEAARRILGRRPDMKVLYVSGYTDDAALQQRTFEPGIAFLPKPFTPTGLARKVREVLDG